jgi:hypothetical protein
MRQDGGRGVQQRRERPNLAATTSLASVMATRTDEGSGARERQCSGAGKVMGDSEGIGKGVELGYFAGREFKAQSMF